ncbi:MAG: hypothetical protein PHV97_02505 [Candidatus Omnitrophica bacterium]|nr:hypothetical protein [Candidatus Omnitrophota bacterium]
MKLIRLFRKYLLLSVAFLLIIPAVLLRAEKSESPSKGFSLSLSQDWIELPLPFQGVVVSYGKKGTLATFHITERKLDEVRTVEQLKWADLFSPQFESIDIRTENSTVLGGEKAKFCVYTLKPGEFKKTMEGKLPAKYINYILIHQGKLYSITFKDTADGFPLTYPSFLAAIRTLRFDTPAAIPQRRST